MKYKDIKGQVFGMVLAVKVLPESNSAGQRMWECVCKCGTVFVTAGNHLRSGHTKSCGCIKRQTAKNNLSRTPSHVKNREGA